MPRLPKFASWQRNILCADEVSLAQLKRDPGMHDWRVIFPSGSPLLTRENGTEHLDGAQGHPTFWQARRYANAVALAEGYQILGTQSQHARVKASGSARRLS
jgi:hypothetical protein